MTLRRFLVPTLGGFAMIAAACSSSPDAVETVTDSASPAAVQTVSETQDPMPVNQMTSAENSAETVSVSFPATAEDDQMALTVDASDAQQPTTNYDPGLIVAAQEDLLNAIYVQLLPSVVEIEVEQQVGRFSSNGNGAPEFLPQGEGSGFVWDSQGHIVTNWHVVDSADDITVLFEDGLELKAELVGADEDSDLAVLKVELPSDRYVPVMTGDSDAVRVGQLVAAIGDPFGQGFTLTSGIVSAVGRTIRGGTAFSIPEVIQTDAAMNPGNSGGPLVDRFGRVIGINSQIISRTGANSGVGFAIPINVAKQVVPVLISDGRYEHPWLGVGGVSLRADDAEEMGLPRDTRGALVTSVTEDGPADEAEVMGSNEVHEDARRSGPPLGGDVITGIAGATVEGVDDLIAYLAYSGRPGDEITLELIRAGNVMEVTVVLGTRPD